MVSQLREYKYERDKEVKKDNDMGKYEVGVVRVTNEVKHNLYKPIMSLRVLLIEEWESQGN